MIRYIAILFLITSVASAQVVEIPDPNLREAIEAELGKAAGETITVADMETLRWLNSFDANISDLTGLEAATELMELYLYESPISDLSPLAGLTQLTGLYFGGTQITDITPLSGLTNLIYLQLSSNPITDITPLSGLTNLISLELVGNEIVNISPLSGLTNLTELSLFGNPIEDITPLCTLLEQNPDLTVDIANECDPDTEPPTADINSDGIVNILDLVLVAAAFGSVGDNLVGDVNSDGVVNILDLVAVAGQFQ